MWVCLGFLTYTFRPDLLGQFQELLDQIFRDILGREELELNFSSALLIFQNNLLTAVLSIFAGVVLALVPLLSIALNFFILGFLLAVFTLAFQSLSHLPGLLVFVLSLVPHGILEIPALLIATGAGLKLGMSWVPLKRPYWFKTGKRLWGNFKLGFQILPLIVVMLFLSALLEVFVTGNLVKFFVE